MEGSKESLDGVRLTGEADEAQIVRAANEYLHPLQPYGPTKALREMTRRIMALDTAKGPYRLQAMEAAHLAQVAASAQLNPFTGEIWAWVNVKGDGTRALTIMPGRRGLLRHAHEQAKEQGTHFWPEYDQIVDPEERADLRIPQGALAFRCRLKDHKDVETWTMAINACKEAGYTPDEIRREVGPMPFTVGIGILTKQEMATLDRKSSNKMSHVERCQKRAYMMALKQRFDLPLGGSVGAQGETIDDYVLDSEWREVDEEDIIDAEFKDEEGPRAEKAPRAPRAPSAEAEPRAGQDPGENQGPDPSRVEAARKGAEALYGEPAPIKPKGRSWDEGVIKACRATPYFPKNAASRRIVATLNLSPFNDDDEFAWIEEWLGIYKETRESIEEPAKAAPIATRKWAIAHQSDEKAKGRFGAKTLKNWAK